MKDLLEVIRERRTARGPFKCDPVPKEQIDALIEAARWAPSSHNSQPWKFIVIDDPRVKEEIGGLILEVVRFDRELLAENQRWLRFTPRELAKEQDGIYLRYFRLLPGLGRLLARPGVASRLDRLPPLRLVAKEMAALVREAPVLICFAVDASRWFAPGDDDLEGLLSLGACFQNISLTASYLGLGCQPMSSLIEFPRGREGLQKILRHPPEWVPISLLRIGYEEAAETMAARLDPNQMVFWNWFGNSDQGSRNEAPEGARR